MDLPRLSSSYSQIFVTEVVAVVWGCVYRAKVENEVDRSIWKIYKTYGGTNPVLLAGLLCSQTAALLSHSQLFSLRKYRLVQRNQKSECPSQLLQGDHQQLSEAVWPAPLISMPQGMRLPEVVKKPPEIMRHVIYASVTSAGLQLLVGLCACILLCRRSREPAYKLLITGRTCAHRKLT